MLDQPLRPDPLQEPIAVRASSRLAIIDKLRGLVIVVMILDHVRDFFHHDALLFSSTDLARTNVALFATRWVTHLCAPTFVLLAGVSIFLQYDKGKRGWTLARFLLTRGLWLILLEVTWVSFAFGFSEPFILLQVIWAIGFSFVLMAGFVAVPPPAMLALGLVIVVGHDAFDAVSAKAFGSFAPLWTLMMHPGRLGFVPSYVAYPALPWFGIMATGYGAGGLFLMQPARRDRWLVAIGLAMLAAFAVLRGIDAYGDPSRWVDGADTTHTMLGFLKVTKYPPSLDYTLATLGLVLTAAPLIGKLGGVPGRMIETFGRVPLFVYLIHLYIAHGLALAIGATMGIAPHLFAATFADPSRLLAAGWGFSLGWVYVVWIGIVLALWPLAIWFAAFKARRRDWWLSYI